MPQVLAVKVRFSPHCHPFVAQLMERLAAGTVSRSLDADTETKPGSTEFLFLEPFQPPGLTTPYYFLDSFANGKPDKELEFSQQGAYSTYNWELFFHVPFAIAVHLSKSQRYADSQRWFHYIFDPTDSSNAPSAIRHWRFRVFRRGEVQLVQDLLLNLATGDDETLQKDVQAAIDAWRANPFRPHLIARVRPTAYMVKTVMAYLDNLVAWGDSLFREDTRESVNEALQLYILAALILGPRPQRVRETRRLPAESYASVRTKLDAFSNAQVEHELAGKNKTTSSSTTENFVPNVAESVGRYLYFCVPANERLLQYWDLVADRLFKVRNSLDLDGTFRQLPLFEPPVDPALLIKARAAGVSVADVWAGAHQPLPRIRFLPLVQRAAELAQEVKSLGQVLLSALEKKDNEQLALLRATHERVALERAEELKALQTREAGANVQALQATLRGAHIRWRYYEFLLGAADGAGMSAFANAAVDQNSNPDQPEAPLSLRDIPGLAARPGRATVESMANNFITGLGTIAAGAGSATVFGFNPAGIAAGLTAGANLQLNLEQGLAEVATDLVIPAEPLVGLSPREREGLDKLRDVQFLQRLTSQFEQMASGAAMLPNFNWRIAETSPVGTPLGPSGFSMFVSLEGSLGGTTLNAYLTALAAHVRALANEASSNSARANLAASYERRLQEWTQQSNAAASEFNQVLKQLRAAQIREAIAQREFENHKVQKRQAEDVEHFLSGEDGRKTSTAAFYAWMKREVQTLHGRVYEFAYDVARKAERSLQYELGDDSLGMLETTYLSGAEGLLAGEKLYFDVKRMEMAYHEGNRREYELVRHVSLLQLAPIQLVALRNTGKCEVSIPESLFDLDAPGHYFRRIRSVSVSIPSVTGPYTPVTCKLTLKKSAIRTKATLQGTDPLGVGANYIESPVSGDTRFRYDFARIESIVTSTASSDPGIFEPGVRDERYFPFEGVGAISTWTVELPADFPQFDHQTITDVLLHLRYTARAGGEQLKSKAVDALEHAIDTATAAGCIRLFSLRREFPTEWAAFKAATETGKLLQVNIDELHYPYWSKVSTKHIHKTLIAVVGVDVDVYASAAGGTPLFSLVAGDPLVVFSEGTEGTDGEFDCNLYLSNNTLVEDVLLAIRWGHDVAP